MSDPLNDSQCDLDVSFAPLADVSLESERDLNTTLNDTRKLRKNLGETFAQLQETSSSDETNNENSNHAVTKQQQEQQEQDPAIQSVARKIAHFEEQAVSTTKNTTRTNTLTAQAHDDDPGFSVYLRLRPIQGGSEASTITILPTQKAIRTQAPPTSHAYKVARNVSSCKEYEFAHVFVPETTQQAVYRRTVQPYVRGVVQQGESALVFCYGITNAGKTYTVTGPDRPNNNHNTSAAASNSSSNSSSWGLVPRAVQELLEQCHNRHHRNVTLEVSYFEIYKERVYDLLSSNNTFNKSQGMLALKNLSKHTIANLEQGLECIAHARRNRRSATNSINRDSSRSHAVCQLRVVRTDTQQHADLWIVDLAGSERSKRTGGTRSTEAAAINQSLMTLNRCLTTLRASSSDTNSSNKRVPWRESKLTSLFAAHWMGPYARRTTMIVNVNPSVPDFDETQHVLAYATVARSVQLEAAMMKNATNNNNKVEYGLNGRRIRTAAESKQPSVARRIMTKVIRTLSPKRYAQAKTAKNLGKQQAKQQQHGKRPPAELVRCSKKMRSAAAASGSVNDAAATGTVRNTDSSLQADPRKELQHLKMALSIERAESAMLKSRNQELQEQLETMEDTVRSEVVEEMEVQMQTMRQQYGSMIDTMRAQLLQENSQDQVSSMQLLQMQRAEQKIRQLAEQVEECEDEMTRMVADHRNQLDEQLQRFRTWLVEHNEHDLAQQMQAEFGMVVASSNDQKVVEEEEELMEADEDSVTSDVEHVLEEAANEETCEEYEQENVDDEEKEEEAVNEEELMEEEEVQMEVTDEEESLELLQGEEQFAEESTDAVEQEESPDEHVLEEAANEETCEEYEQENVDDEEKEEEAVNEEELMEEEEVQMEVTDEEESLELLQGEEQFAEESTDAVEQEESPDEDFRECNDLEDGEAVEQDEPAEEMSGPSKETTETEKDVTIENDSSAGESTKEQKDFQEHDIADKGDTAPSEEESSTQAESEEDDNLSDSNDEEEEEEYADISDVESDNEEADVVGDMMGVSDAENTTTEDVSNNHSSRRVSVRLQKGRSDIAVKPSKESSSSNTRKPLSSLSNKPASSDMVHWMVPKKAKLKVNPATGGYLRPRGRMPKDATGWDETRGMWRVSIVKES